MAEKNISQEFRVKKIKQINNIFDKEIDQNEFFFFFYITTSNCINTYIDKVNNNHQVLL